MYVGLLPHLIGARSAPWKEVVQDTQELHVILTMLRLSVLTMTRDNGPIHSAILAAGDLREESYEEHGQISPLVWRLTRRDSYLVRTRYL